MKKINLMIALLFSAITYSQIINYTSIRLEDGQDADYIKYEEFWSKIHEQAIEDGLENGWMIWEVVPIEGDENAANQPDFLVMQIFQDSVQLNK